MAELQMRLDSMTIELKAAQNKCNLLEQLVAKIFFSDVFWWQFSDVCHLLFYVHLLLRLQVISD